MSTENTLEYSQQVLRAKFLFVAFSPALAWATEQRMASEAIGGISMLTWLAMLGFATLGWIVSDLDKVAELWKPGEAYERWKERLKLWKGIAASNLAGIFTFFIGKGAPGLILSATGLKVEGGGNPVIPEMLLFLMVAGAGYMGTRWFSWLERKVTGGV